MTLDIVRSVQYTDAMTTTQTFDAASADTSALVTYLKNTLDDHSRYKRSWFWSPGSTSSQRRYNEQRFPIEDAIIENTPKGTVTIYASYNESCRHCYYSMTITRDGKKTTSTVLKTILKKVQGAQG